MTAAAATPSPVADKTRLLIVDDSLYMRMAIRTMVGLRPDIEVVGEAASGDEAVALAKSLTPDVITMDINMPGTDGIEATRRIVEQGCPAVVMVSSLTEKGVEATFEALEAGAVDYIPKSASALDIDLSAVAADVVAKVHFWRQGVSHGVALPVSDRAGAIPLALPLDCRPDMVLLVAGDGSPQVVREVLSGLGTLPVPIVVVQEMAPNFTAPFIAFLRRTTGLTVREALPGSAIAAGEVTVLPGGKEAHFLRNGNDPISVAVTRPSGRSPFDRIMTSAAAVGQPLVVVLGGQSSCRQGAAAVGAKGIPILVQQRASCLVATLPASALAAGILHLEAPAARLAATVRAILIPDHAGTGQSPSSKAS